MMEQKQRIQLRIFKEFKRICGVLNLSYFAIGGTCIGAVRHAGFIPWDDDIDIGMFVEDYNEFISKAPEMLDERYSLYRAQDHPTFEWDFVKIQDEETTDVPFGKKTEKDQFRGICIDIMPVYGLPKERYKRFVRTCTADLLLFFNRRLRQPYYNQKNFAFKIMHLCLSPLRIGHRMNLFIDMKEKYLSGIRISNSDKVLFGWRLKPSRFRKDYSYRNEFYYEDFASTIEVRFEDESMMIPAGYDRYLKMDFGEYMQLPPEEKRTPSHKADILDCSRSYALYIKDLFEE